MTTTGAAARRSRAMRMVVVPEVATRINRPAGRPVRLHLRRAARPDRRASRRTPSSRFWAAPSSEPSPHGASTRTMPRLADPLHPPAPSPMRSIARPSSRRCGRAAPRVPAGLQWEFYGADVPSTTGRCRPSTRPRSQASSCTRTRATRASAIPYRLLNNYYTNQAATAQVLVGDVALRSASPCRSQMKENWQPDHREREPQRAVRDWSNSAGFNDPDLLDRRRSTARRASSSRSANGPTRR